MPGLIWAQSLVEERVKAWQIFRHSVRQVTGNLPAALRVSLVPMAVQVVVLVAMIATIVAFSPMIESGGPDLGLTLGFLAGVVVVAITALWIAVAWHRFILMGEAPRGWIPAFHGARLWAYFLRSLGQALVTGLVAVILGMVVGLVVDLLFPSDEGREVDRHCPSGLPASPDTRPAALGRVAGAAIDGGQGFGVSWDATEGATGTLLALAGIGILAQLGLSLVGSALDYANLWILSAAWQLVVSWLVTMVGVSVLTTLYGHYVEGRPLV
ncbi:MAG: hypothetical protein HZT43_19720 [Exiguobacterium profundum]|nr:MAG: hypothetical protein HZT43_19720 [Exiguobacterium profundum]